MTELWRDVVGYEGLYEVSNFGNVRSVKGGRRSGKVLKPGTAYHLKKHYRMPLPANCHGIFNCHLCCKGCKETV